MNLSYLDACTLVTLGFIVLCIVAIWPRRTK